jgi:serine/threonine protein kinase
MNRQQLGHYIIHRKLGAGGMGVVWLAEDTHLERKVAIKILPYVAAQYETEKARFIQEAKAAARLNHANIAQVYEISEEDGELYIVMEYLSGGSLRDRLADVKGRALPLNEVLNWIMQTAAGLAEAHRQGIIHRDIKPDNLMLTESGEVKITDFGLARLESSATLTASGATLGTVNYMSPEQVLGKKFDHRADLFSLGATCFELLTGHRAFEGPDAAATFYSILNDETEPLTRFRRDLPSELTSLVDKLLQKDPDLRCQTAQEVVAELRRLQSGFHRRQTERRSPYRARGRGRLSRRMRVLVLGLAVVAIGTLSLFQILKIGDRSGTAGSPEDVESGQQVATDSITIGVLDLNRNNVDPGEARAVSERLRIFLARTGVFIPIDRDQVELILSEHGFQLSGAIDTDEVVIQVGKILGALKMVAGSISRIGTLYSLQVRLVNVSTARIEQQAFVDVGGIEELLTSGVESVARQLAGLDPLL